MVAATPDYQALGPKLDEGVDEEIVDACVRANDLDLFVADLARRVLASPTLRATLGREFCRRLAELSPPPQVIEKGGTAD